MGIVLTEHDKHEISQKFPTLNCSLRRGMIWGTMFFECCYDYNSNEIVFDSSLDNFIEDSYEIRVDFNKTDTFGFPQVYEESGIIKDFAQKKGIKLEDLHINKNDKENCCLGIFPEYKWSGATKFIEEKVVPFFYWQSYRRIFEKEPWKGYSHGKDGIFEAMSSNSNAVSKGSIRNQICQCGSKKKYKKCCLKKDKMLKEILRTKYF